jgi:hypothetical protein
MTSIEIRLPEGTTLNVSGEWEYPRFLLHSAEFKNVDVTAFIRISEESVAVVETLANEVCAEREYAYVEFQKAMQFENR